MADKHSFDIVSKINLQQLADAINQALREIGNRYDLKDSKTTIEFNNADNILTLESENDYKLTASKDIFNNHLIKRKISIKAFIFTEPEKASGSRIRQKATVQQGIPQEKAKEIVKFIKTLNTKTQAQITGDSLRVTGKKIDDLQTIIQELKNSTIDCAMTFENFK